MSSTVSQYLWAIISVVLIVISIVFHEVGHGFAAYRMGDTTAKSKGRLSLNPMKHIDPFGSVILPLILFLSGGPIIGYAKPVPYNPNRLKNRRKGELVVGLAGPGANFALALIGAGIAFLAELLFSVDPTIGYWVWNIAAQFVIVNLCLMFFNLIPLPPLDGSSIIAPFLSEKGMKSYYKVQQYSLPILLIILILIPMMTSFDPVGWYIDNTAIRMGSWLLGM
ncbi:MAG: site-2 protease family protein [Actinobacteria bacterium]|nr:site-2 protease family protein [Actinomycetota bacterium]